MYDHESIEHTRPSNKGNIAMPIINPYLWELFYEYLNSRELSSTLARLNKWYPSNSANDTIPRIVIPAYSSLGYKFWQARAMSDAEKRYQSPSAAREDSIIVVSPFGKPAFSLVCEGPMDALAGAMLGGQSIALMGNTPPESSLNLTSTLIRAILPIIVVADNDNPGPMGALLSHFSQLGPSCLLLPPAGFKDLAACPILLRKELFKELIPRTIFQLPTLKEGAK